MKSGPVRDYIGDKYCHNQREWAFLAYFGMRLRSLGRRFWSLGWRRDKSGSVIGGWRRFSRTSVCCG